MALSRTRSATHIPSMNHRRIKTACAPKQSMAGAGSGAHALPQPAQQIDHIGRYKHLDVQHHSLPLHT